MKVAFVAPTKPAKSDAPRGPSRGERETATLIASLVRSAPAGAEAWGRLMIGVEIERSADGVDLLVPILVSPERMAANDAGLEVGYKIAKGWEFIVRAGDRVPRVYLERLCELEAESLDRLAELDDVRRREAEAAGKEFPDAAACMLNRACLEAAPYLRDTTAGPTVEAALELLGRAIDLGDPEAVAIQAKRYVREAVWQRYGSKVVEDGE